MSKLSALEKFVFRSPGATAKLEERIKALRKVREMVKAPKFLDEGYSAQAFDAGDHVVKMPRGQIMEKKMKRRGFLESILADNDLAPKTFLVETRGQKYMVQPKADFFSPFTPHPDADLIRKGMEAQKMTARDVAYNVGEFGPLRKPLLIDASEDLLQRATKPSERQSALEKFISYGKRAKPWLDE
jgi:hypothetical protein